MKTRWPLTSLFCLLLLAIGSTSGLAKTKRFGELLCTTHGYKCLTVQRGDTWESLFADENQRNIVRRLNRLNIRLRPKMVLAVPEEFADKTAKQIVPFPDDIGVTNQKLVLIDLTQLAWGAYDSEGKLVRWGPASGGKNWCPDLGRRCRTPSREFAIKRKGSAKCKSRKFPIPKGGAPMPYCMFFYGGYAIHGSPQVPGYNASHGCIRTFTEDARWLNESFIDLPDKKNDLDGTKIIVLPYSNLKTASLSDITQPLMNKLDQYKNFKPMK